MMKWINKKRNRKGFTLVELVVVIAILGILAAIAVPKLSGSRNTAKVATHNANVRILKSTGTMYLTDHGQPEDEDENLYDDEDFQKYFDDGKMPETYEGKHFEVFIKDGDIEVKPGEVKIEEGKVVEK